MELSLNTQAILLLTAPLLAGRKRTSDVAPLPNREYNKLAARLLELGYAPADLLGPQAGNMLAECGPGLDAERIAALLERGFLLTLALGRWSDCSLWVISRADPEYPRRFKMRLKQQAPPVLYGCGELSLLENGGLAVVGSRNVGDELIEYAEKIAGLAAAAQCSIISGGARGVDRAAMRGALTGGGQVIGVLADSLEKAALERDNRDAVLNDQLLLISPYDPKAGFNVGNAMGRNKLVYALADAALVVESEYSKGGTWNGAVEQLDNKMRLTPVYTRSDGNIGKGLSALQRKGALEWPNPQTPAEFAMAMAGEMRHPQQEPRELPLAEPIPAAAEASYGSAATSPPTGGAWPEHDPAGLDEPVPSEHAELPLHETLASSGSLIGEAADNTASPADSLYTKVKDLLSEIVEPVTDDYVAAYLDIEKRQAKRWLERLATEGVYIRRGRPVRYERTNTKLL